MINDEKECHQSEITGEIIDEISALFYRLMEISIIYGNNFIETLLMTLSTQQGNHVLKQFLLIGLSSCPASSL